MINLFEYQNKEVLADSFEGLEVFLDEVWNARERNAYFYNSEDSKIESQRFLQFLHKSDEVKSNKYVGVIHYNGQKINLLPKIFFKANTTYSDQQISQIHNHILWWLSYCRKIKFPNYHTSLGDTKSDFFEVLIYLFSKYTRELLSNSLYQQYQEINQELSFIKGRLNTSRYINRNLSTGRWHKLNCTYNAFVFDNEFNRIIKYVAKLLFNITSTQDNKKNLREILFILDDVADETKTAEQCAKIQFNPIFGAFEAVRDYCYLFLSNCISFDYKNDLKLFAFLLPMEYVFEDFLFGFIDKEIDSINAKSQRSDTYLDEAEIFKLKPDLFLETATQSFIADAKYKIVYTDTVDSKKGISQSDLYQMVAYAIRFKVKDILLFYPNTVNGSNQENVAFKIKDLFAEEMEITIRAFQLPIIDYVILNSPIEGNVELLSLFEQTTQKLTEIIRLIIKGE